MSECHLLPARGGRGGHLFDPFFIYLSVYLLNINSSATQSLVSPTCRSEVAESLLLSRFNAILFHREVGQAEIVVSATRQEER